MRSNRSFDSSSELNGLVEQQLRTWKSTNPDSTKASSVSKTVFENQIRKRSLWNVSEVAQFLRVSPRTVRDWVYKRVIPFRKAGASVRFDPVEIERWTLPNKE